MYYHLGCIFFIVLLNVDVNADSQAAQKLCLTSRNEPGFCVPILECKTIVQLLKMSPKPLPPSVAEIVRNSHCGTVDSIHYVCCGKNSKLSTTDRVTNVSRSTISPNIHPSISESEFNIKSGMALLEANSCEQDQGNRALVGNGDNAGIAEFPWMALLVYDNGLERTLDCGGSLITTRYVLTAAHCIRVSSKKLVSVRLGEYDLSQAIDCAILFESSCIAPPQEIDIEEAIYHKDFSSSKFSDDIGLIRLIQKASLEFSVYPICLPISQKSQATPLSQITIAGWGRIENGDRANILQKADVPVRKNDYCQGIHKLITITEKHLCAGGEKNIDTCKGDSGGPVFSIAPYRKGPQYIQFGIVSAGASQCGSKFPGVYMRVTSYLQWIAGNMRE